MLERMSEFFKKRLEGYDEHMLSGIEGAREFYAYTASLLPVRSGCRVLDLGCGTGLELEAYFAVNPGARITGVDLSEAMLGRLAAKFADKAVDLVCASYFDAEFGSGIFDAAVSVESLHHFEKAKKTALYARLREALKPEGCFILTDYFAQTPELEAEYFRRFAALKAEQGVDDGAFYHFDTPLTAEHETEALYAAGFSRVELKKRWGATCTLAAYR